MAEPEQDLYEELELADDAIEDIYEDLPDTAYNDVPISPPPLPSTPIPSITSPAHNRAPPPPSDVPPIPTRAVATTLSKNPATNNNLQRPGKPVKSATLKGGKPLKAPPPIKSKGGGGGGGIDISEIMKKARQRTGSSSAIMDLESKIGEKKEEENAHVAPWANQLRKPKVPPPVREGGKQGEGEEKGTVPPWVKRKVDAEDSSTEPRGPPPVGSKPAAPVANVGSSDGPPSPPSDGKPPWLRQRERQQQMAKSVAGSTGGGGGEKPSVVPKPAAKPPPMAPKPATKPPPSPPGPKLSSSSSSEQPPPPSPRKVRPVPAPRGENPAPDSTEAPDESPPTQSASVMAKAKMFAEASKPAVAPKIASKPPPIKPHAESSSPHVAPRVEKKSPTPPPIPTRDSSIAQRATQRSPSPIPEDTPPPPPPSSRPPPLSVRPPPPDMPPPPTSPPPPSSQPPKMPPPPSTGPPGPPSLPERNAPKLPLPSPPSSHPPPSLPATQAQPTPPTGSVMKFRRRPLQSVDPNKPPPLPPPNTKPAIFPILPPSLAPQVPPPAAAGRETEEAGEGDEPEEIYEDTLAGAPDDVMMDGPDELYDDISQLQSSKPPLSTPISAPPLPPSLPPPSIRPPPPLMETPVMNYETDPSLQQNGVTQDDVTQELYEDLNPDDSQLFSQAPPISTLALPLPPSPSQSSLSGGSSPSLDRKQKLSKEQKRLQKEEEKKKKDMKKREETRAKNRAKALKTFKEFKLPNDVKSLFTVEITEDHPKAKDHMAVSKGEQCFVLLINHPKLPDERYFIEREDGTMGFVKKAVCQRIGHQTVQSEPSPAPEMEQDYEDKDIYEELPMGEGEDDLHGIPPPALPPPNMGILPPTRFPAPSQAPPPPPPEDEPQDNYEYLPEPAEQGSY